ncbi:MAG TPA: hypothetical protein VKP11_07335 [Frankiaceae bacterium]|nr:hypothetical protein [Frankiaceae bacterium]
MEAQRVSQRVRRSLAAPGRRRVVLLVALGVVLFVVAAVAVSLYGKPQRVEAVVVFAPGATGEQKAAVRRSCPGVGKAVQEPPDQNELRSSLVYPLRYDITEASATDKAALYRCMKAQTAVAGISELRQGD